MKSIWSDVASLILERDRIENGGKESESERERRERERERERKKKKRKGTH